MIQKAKDAELKKKLWIGQIAVIGKWLRQEHEFSFKEEEIKVLTDADENLRGYEFLVDDDILKLELENFGLSDTLLAKAKVKILIEV